jgi:hypothetical protein
VKLLNALFAKKNSLICKTKRNLAAWHEICESVLANFNAKRGAGILEIVMNFENDLKITDSKYNLRCIPSEDCSVEKQLFLFCKLKMSTKIDER